MANYYVLAISSGTTIRQHDFKENPEKGGYLFTEDQALRHFERVGDALMPVAIPEHNLERILALKEQGD